MILRFLTLSLFFLSCVEPYEPNIKLNTSFLVITGEISDINPAQVRVEKTIAANTSNVSMNSKNNVKITGATVLLIDENENQEELINNRDGTYSGVNKGVIGNTYRIEVRLPDNSIVTSSPQLLKPCPDINEVYTEQSTGFEIIDGYQNTIYGLNLFLYLDNSEYNSKYFRWSLSGMYEFSSPFDIAHPCYVSEPFGGYSAVDESISSDKDLILKDLIFLESNGRKFSILYSMEVSQYSLTEEAYEYWKKIDDQQNNVGSVFDSPPASIIGNLSFIDDENTPVLGFFGATSVKKKRIFINPSDFLEPPVLETVACSFDNPPSWCFNCTNISGSSRNKPTYWPN